MRNYIGLGGEHQENSLNANKTSWKILLLSNEDASAVVTLIYCCYCLRERYFYEINFHCFQRAAKRSEMEIFNLFVRRFLTIKFNDDVINKSKKHSLIPREFFALRLLEPRPQFRCWLSHEFYWKEMFWERKMLNLIKMHKYCDEAL